jgi:eukaryotic-like serine/threonine-protein kinase
MDFDTAIAAPAFRDLADLVAEQTRTLVAWIGAGLSMPAKLPSWMLLRRLLHEAATAKVNTFSEPDRTRKRASLDKIVGIKDPWTAFERLSTILGRESFAAEVRRHLSITGKTIPESYQLLLRLPLRGILSLNTRNGSSLPGEKHLA